MLDNREYLKEWRKKKLAENPNYYKEIYQRKKELHPNHCKELYQRTKELHPNIGKEKYQIQKELRPNYIKEYNRKDVNKKRLQCRLTYLNNREKRLQYNRIYRANNKEKRQAQHRLGKLFRDANINTETEFNCALCPNEYGFKINKHHFDYHYWNWFIPLCYSCHRNVHNIEKGRDTLANHRIDINLNKRKDN